LAFEKNSLILFVYTLFDNRFEIKIPFWMLHVENNYRVERLEIENYINTWGLVDFDKKAITLENLLNDMFEKGYRFNSIISQKDSMGKDADFYVFIKELIVR
jgi:hypothetical protein